MVVRPNLYLLDLQFADCLIYPIISSKVEGGSSHFPHCGQEVALCGLKDFLPVSTCLKWTAFMCSD